MSPSRVIAFAVAIGIVGANAEEWRPSLLWNKELDINDYAQMDLSETFYQWSKDFDMSYADDVEEYSRFIQFTKNIAKIAQVNSAGYSYKLRPNQFTHLSEDEFRQYVHGDSGACYSGAAKERFPLLNKLERDFETLKEVDAPSSVDWEKEGKVTPVKDQGQCGSCWAFSTTGSLECNYAIQKGKLNSLSEQQLVDCSHLYGNLGCAGGQMDAAFKYVENNGGLCLESAYPYKASGGSCDSSSCGTFYNANSGYTDVQTRSDSSLENAAAAGCVSVAIEADQFAFQYYSSGVLTGTCGTRLDHGVLVVGYGSEGGQDYWKVKNSWGTSWGEQGYVLICRDCNKNGSQGECGINDEPSYPTFA